MSGPSRGEASTERVVVVGAGVAGACVADHLARETDREVVVLERGAAPADETTARSGGFVGFWGHESPGQVPLLRYGVRYYADLLSGPDPPARFVHGGRLRLATTDAGDQALRDDFAAWFDHAVHGAATTGTRGAPVQYLSGERLGETLVLPDLATDRVTGALYSPGVGHVDDPAGLARGVLARAQRAGATVRTGAAVTAVATDGGRATGVRVDTGNGPDPSAAEGGTELVAADAVVAAAGPWNRRLLATADVALPVANTRGPMLVLAGDRHGLPALYHEESGTYTRQNRDGTLYVGHFPGGYDGAAPIDPDDVGDRVPEDRRAACLDALDDLLAGTRDATVTDEWVGVRQVTPDGVPVVGETAVAGLSVVAFNADGVQYAPAAGSVLAARLDGREPDLPTGAVAADRFE